MSRNILFGGFELRPEERQLLVNGVPAALGSRAFDVLLALIERRDRVVSKNELLDLAWAGIVVEENNLSVQISSLRKVLGAQAIATVSGRGYRFVMPAEPSEGMPPLPSQRSEAPGHVQRRLVAIVCADIVAWSDALGRDAAAAVGAWKSARTELVERRVPEFGGRVIELTAERLLVEFASAVDAIRWAVDLQQRLAARRVELPHPALRMRMGVGVDDLVVDDGKLVGEAAMVPRLLQAALPDQIVVTEPVRLCAENKLPVRFRAVDSERLEATEVGSAVLWIVEPVPLREGVFARQLDFIWQNRPKLAVLPFSVESDVVDPYYGDGVTEEIITSLSVNRALFVIARNSTLRYRNSTRTNLEIASDLGVRYLLAGSLHRPHDRLRIFAELVDAGVNRVMWAENFDGAQGDVFRFQSDIASRIAAAIDPSVQTAEIERERQKQRPTDSLSAYDSVLRGLSTLYRLRGPEFDRAGQMFRRAIELDPHYAQAHAYLAWWHNLRFGEGRSPQLSQDGREALQLSQRAVALDPRDAVVLSVAGHIQSLIQRKFSVAMRMFDQALSINPSCAVAWARSATTLAYMGDGEQALRRVENAMKLSPYDPLSFSFCTTNGIAALVAGRYAEAVGQLSKARRLNADYRAALRLLIAALALSGEIAEARELAQEFLLDVPGFRVSEFGAWYPLCEPHLGRLLDGMRLGGLPD